MNVTPDRIFILEDDKELVEVLQARLTREGFEVEFSHDGLEGYQQVVSNPPALVLLDLMLPGMRGMDVCRKLRENDNTKMLPVLMLTANADETDVVLGLEFGADDYVTKPFNFRQLVARIRAVLRRSKAPRAEATGARLIVGPLAVNPSGREVTVDQKPVALTESEFQVLHHLAVNVGKVCTRTELLQLLSGDGGELVERNVDVHIASLRKKLGDFGRFVITVRSVGYKLATSDQIAETAPLGN